MNDSFLQEQGVSGALIESVQKFRESYPVAEGLENRMMRHHASNSCFTCA